MVEKALSSQSYGKLTDRYAHDALDQLTSYVGYDGYQQQFTYDANGMRLSKKETGDTSRSTLEELLRGNIAGLPEIVEPAQSQTNANGADAPTGLEWATTEYLYDLTQEYYQVISETTTYANGTSATTAYAYGLERIAAYNENGVTRYVYDGRGSVAQTVTAPVAGESVTSALPKINVQVQSISYTAFGEQMGGVKVSGFTYNAEAYDAATGMLNLRARLYEPALGRFSQKDIYPPNLLITYSFNAYLFTFNSPVSFVDADGLQASSLRNVLSSIGNTVKKAASAIGNGIKKVASALVGETVVNTVISKVKSVAKAVKNVVKPVVDVATSAWQKAKECLAEAQEEIRALEETRPVSEAEKNEIIRRACAKFLGLDDTTSSASIQTTEQMYTVEGGMVLHTTKNPYGRIVLPPGTYTQAEIVSFIMEYGDSVMIRDVMDLIAKGSATATFPDGSTVTITAQEGLQNLINANREQATLEAWEPSFWQQAGMVVGQAFDQAIKGDYAEETTPVGTLAQIGVGFIPVADTITDIRDFTYSAQQFWYKPSWGNAGWVAVDLIGFIPVLGSLKPVFKHGDEFIDATGTVIKNVDNMVDATGTVIRKADDVADVATDIAKHGDDFVQSLPSSKKLRRNLELAGVEVPDYPNAAHHIVAGSAPGAENAREILTKFGIDINDSSNGVFLPTQRNVVNSAYHPSLHSTEYYEKVDDMLSAATNREEAIEILHEIADQLAEGTSLINIGEGIYMNIWTLEHEKQEHIMFYTIEKWDIAYTLSFDGSKKADSWNKPQIYSDYHPESHPYVDYPGFVYHTAVCIFSKKATDVLLPVIRNDVEVLPVISTEGSYCAINVTNVGDYIDYEHTKAKLFKSSGRIMSFLALAFQQDAIKNTNIFRLPVGPKKYYVSDSFRNAVLNNDLSGFRFDLVWSSNF